MKKFTRRAIDIIAEQKIKSAMQRGEFSNLPGFGKPIVFENEHDPYWWIRQKLKHENLFQNPSVAETKKDEHEN